MELPDELEGAIRASPDDRAGYAVASDWLLQQGHPQGELCALSLAGEDEALADRIIELKTQLAPVDVGGLSPLTLEWRWGFVRGVLLSSIRDAGEAAMLRTVLGSPLGRFVQKLVLIGVSRRAIEAVVDVAREQPRALGCVRSLVMHVDESVATSPVELGPLWRALPTLERVALRVAHASGFLHLPRLVELSISRVVRATELIGVSRLPALRTLRCDLIGEVPLPDEWLHPDRLPALRTLSITHGRPVPFRAWQHARIAHGLELLDLFGYAPGREYERRFVVDTPRIAQPAGLLMMAGRRRVRPGTLIPLEGRFSIGRGAGNDLVLDGPDVDALHAELLRPRQHVWHVRQRGQAQLSVNGHTVQELELRSGDELAIGHHVFRFLEGDTEQLAAELRIRFGL
jgi:uncharacterized protein (TIGR02996 family)